MVLVQYPFLSLHPLDPQLIVYVNSPAETDLQEQKEPVSQIVNGNHQCYQLPVHLLIVITDSQYINVSSMA